MKAPHASIPVPQDLQHLIGTDPPEMIGTHEAGRLLEHWGYTRHGKGAVVKLVRCHVLEKHVLPWFSGWRFKTAEVLALYQNK